MKRFLSISFCALALGTTALAGTVLAQSVAPAAQAPAPKPFVVNGTVVGMEGMNLTVKDADGKSVTVALAADTLLIRVTKITLDQIKPGSFVATANSADGGVSSELRVFAPPLNGLGEGSYPMQDGQNMTNGTVKTVVTSVKGREMDVGYNPSSPACKDKPDDVHCKAGQRHITVPESMVIHEWSKVEPADLKPGTGVSVRGRVVGDAPPSIRAVFIGENGAPPAM